MRTAVAIFLAAGTFVPAAKAVTVSFTGPVDRYFVAPGSTSRATSYGSVTFDEMSGTPLFNGDLVTRVQSGSISFTGLLDLENMPQDNLTLDASSTTLFVKYNSAFTRISVGTNIDGNNSGTSGFSLYAADNSNDSLTYNGNGRFAGAYFTNTVTAIDDLAIAVPEPGSLLLLAAALSCPALRRRSRRDSALTPTAPVAAPSAAPARP